MSSKVELKICPYPFARMEVRANAFVPCCSSWLSDEYHNMDHGNDVWNGPAAQELRRRIYKGDYSLCKRELCNVPITTIDENEEHEAQINAHNRAAIASRETTMPAEPSNLSVVADPRCNLACPSCRTGYVLRVSEQEQSDMMATEERLKSSAQDLESITFGDGEVLFSPWTRKILQSLSPAKFPKLRSIELKTNGLFLDEKNYLMLMPGAQFIKRITVSMDAGDERTYSSVRGGDWSRLIKNLEWTSLLRRQKKLQSFQVNFTIRTENFKSIPEFVKLGQSLEADSIKFMSFEPWARMAVTNYSEQAIHLPEHPRHFELYNVWEKIKNEPKVRWALATPQRPLATMSI